MQTGDGEQRRDGRHFRRNAAVGQDQNVRAVLDGLVGGGEQFFQRLFQAFFAVRGLEQNRQRHGFEAGRSPGFPRPSSSASTSSSIRLFPARAAFRVRRVTFRRRVSPERARASTRRQGRCPASWRAEPDGGSRRPFPTPRSVPMDRNSTKTCKFGWGAISGRTDAEHGIPGEDAVSGRERDGQYGGWPVSSAQRRLLAGRRAPSSTAALLQWSWKCSARRPSKAPTPTSTRWRPRRSPRSKPPCR